ncbi:MAG: glycosyltransferase family 4 protein [Myxococcota bacterium]
MRIALYSLSFAPTLGGLERFGEDLAEWLTEAGHEVDVVTATGAEASADRHRPYQVVRTGSPAAALAVLRRADVVHVSGLSLRGIGLGRLANRPLVVTHHGYQAVCPTGLMMTRADPCEADGRQPGPCASCPGAGARGRASVLAHRLGARACHANVGVSRYLTRRIGVPRSRAIHNGLTPRALAQAAEGPGEEGLIAFAGRLVEEKGLDLLIRALPSVPAARLHVAGDGPLRGDLQRLANDVGVTDRVRLLGRLPPEEVQALYARAAVVCIPSRWHEPFGYAVSEAMALGRPIVATPMGAFTELLEGGRGFLAEAVTPEALAWALRQALEDPDARAAAGRAARTFAHRELGIDAIGRAYVELYDSVARGRA